MGGGRVKGKLLETVKALVRELTAHTAYHAPVRYRVVQVGPDGRLSLQIVRKASGFPDVLPVQLQAGMPGGKGKPALGSIVLVQFIEGDPTMPIVTHFARPDDAAFVPTEAALDASALLELGKSADTVKLADGVLPVVRVGDAVQAGPFSGTAVGGSTKVMAG